MDDGLDLITGGPSQGDEDIRPARSHRRVSGRRRADERAGAPRGHRANKGKGFRRAVALLAVGALLVAGYIVAGSVLNRFSGPTDYEGRGEDRVIVEIPEGATGQKIAQVLADKNVVASPEAFYQLSLEDDRASAIQPGYYELRTKMSARAALDTLSDKANRVEAKVTVPEGARTGQIVETIAQKTQLSADELTAALENSAELGLPAEAGGNPEGYLYPATYEVPPAMTAQDLLAAMIAKTKAVTAELDIENRAQALGYTTEQILTVASILEYEAKQDADYPKVARVLYNRLAQQMPLQLDSTVSYVSGRKGDVWTTEAERNADSAYNTYQNVGLPPGPIGSPGQKTIEAALNPADGPWLYFVAVNMETGETKYATTLAEHEANAEQAREYCRNSEIC